MPPESVSIEELKDREEPGPLLAVWERMVLDEPAAQDGRLHNRVGLELDAAELGSGRRQRGFGERKTR